ncbi:MAG: acyltransferase [Oscillospiraceae bacterium]|nr:acyltransferase [Oscillospiraceae bacterium]
MSVFSGEYINRGRQTELDLARGLAVFFMVCIHVAEYSQDFPPGIYSNILTFAGGPLAAPAFMILMGAGIVYSKNSSPKKMALRGITLLTLHYALNFFAFGIPLLIKYAQTADGEMLQTFFNYTFGTDILAFSGLTFLLFALKEKLRLQTVHLVIFTLFLSCLNFLFTVSVENPALGLFLGLFARVNLYSWFPLLSWFAYPVIGYIFGDLLKRCADKNLLYKYLFTISVLVMTAMTLCADKYGFNIWSMYFEYPDSYYYQDFFQYILVSGIFFAWISLLYVLSKLKALSFFVKQLSRLSKNITVVYCCQWLIIAWVSILISPEMPANFELIIFAGMIITALSDALAVLYIKIRSNMKHIK